MDLYTVQAESNWAWIIFWSIYWIGGLFLSLYGSRKCVNFEKVKSNLLYGMLISWVLTNVLAVLPIRGVINFDMDYWVQGIWEPVYKLGLALLFAELWFYHVHVLLHQSQFYVKFHKQHHEFFKPYPLAGLYCSTYEMVVCNVISVSIGPILTNLQGFWFYIWFVLVALNVLLTHSPLSTHDIHHRLLNYNYGVINIFDTLYGTWYIKPKSEEINESITYCQSVPNIVLSDNLEQNIV